MGTVFESKSLKFKIHADDHNPPHVHVIGKGCEAIFDLRTLELMFDTDFHPSDVKHIKKVLTQIQGQLMEVWNEYQEK